MSSMVVNGNSKEMLKESVFRDTKDIPVLAGQKVLGVTAKSKITAVETLDGEVRANVKTEFSVVKTDGQEIFTEKTESESQRTIAAEGLTATDKACLTARVTECEKIGSEPVKVRATVEVGGWFVKKKEIRLLDATTEGLKCKTEKVTIENVTTLSENVTTLTFSDEARMPVAKVLDYDCCVTVDAVYPSNGSYRADGELTIRMVAVADNGSIFTQSFSHPINVENAEEFLTESMRLEAEGSVKNAEYSVTESDKRIVVSDVTVKITGVMLEEKETESVKDVYSLQNRIETEEEKAKVNSRFCLRSVREKAAATVSVSGGIREALCVLSPCVSASGRVSEDGIVVEGVIGATVLYSDENGETRTLSGEVPFVSNVGGDYPCETVFTPDVMITAINARPRGSGDVEITAELLVTVRGAQEKEITVISDVKVGEEKEPDDYTICVYVVKKGETLWDVAKELNADEEELIAQNADVTLPLKGGEKILLYKGKEEEIE